MSEKWNYSDLANMEMFEVIEVDAGCELRKVPNGWVLTEYFPDDNSPTSVFIPDVYASELDRVTIQRTHGTGANK